MRQFVQKTATVSVLLVLGSQLLQSAAAFQAASPLKHLLRVENKDDYESTSALYMAKARKARRIQKVEKSRPQQFFDAIQDAEDKEVPKSKPKKGDNSDAAVDAAEAARQERALAAQQRMDQRPEVSTMIVDEETGIELVAQGKAVMDVVSRKAVQLSPLGAQYRLAQMFPGVPPEIRDQYRVDWSKAEVSDLVEGFREAAMVTLPDGSRGIPTHPSISNKAIDYVLANRDRMGNRMKRAMGKIAMRSASLGNKEEAQANNKLWKNFLTVENHISAPFRQIIMDAEGRMGPNFGNMDMMAYAKGDLYERIGNYLVLKGMVAHWEKKVVDADYYEKTPQTKENYITVLARGDPKRYLPDPPILFTLKECTQVCAMAQKMTAEFVNTPELFGDFPPEVKFIEAALSVKGGTSLRKFMIDEFCPAEGITPEALREGVRRLMVQLENMQIDPYADITNIIERLEKAMAVGSEDERDPYIVYLANTDPNGPGSFQTYTFNHEKLSLVRFLDSQYESAGSISFTPDIPSGGLGGFFNFGGGNQPAPVETKEVEKKGDFYKVPKERAAGRPHNLGWLKLLEDDEKDQNMRLGKVKPGKIIME